MTSKVWLGGIYIKNEGGFEVILKALEHYKKRLRTISNSPELTDSAAMFASVINQQAIKTIPNIETTIKKIKRCLREELEIKELETDLEIIEKALACYESDILKAEDSHHDYFVKLVGDLEESKKDLPIIREAIKKIYQFE